jgi:hypothetical protein
MTLNRVYEILRDKQIETIKNKGLTGTQISDEIRAYKNKITKISTILSTNTNFKDCFLFEKIEADIDSYLKSLSII